MRETFCWETLGECGLGGELSLTVSVPITCQALVSFTTITYFLNPMCLMQCLARAKS